MSISVSWFQAQTLWTHALNDMCMYVCLDLGTVHCFLFRFTGYVLHTSICNYHEVSALWLKLHIRAYVDHGIRLSCCFFSPVAFLLCCDVLQLQAYSYNQLKYTRFAVSQSSFTVCVHFQLMPTTCCHVYAILAMSIQSIQSPYPGCFLQADGGCGLSG